MCVSSSTLQCHALISTPTPPWNPPPYPRFPSSVSVRPSVGWPCIRLLLRLYDRQLGGLGLWRPVVTGKDGIISVSDEGHSLFWCMWIFNPLPPRGASYVRFPEGLNGDDLGFGCCTDLLLVVQALVVILQHRRALLSARRVLLVAVDHVAGEHFLPKGKAPGWTW
nr:hypothetical protein 15E6.140 [imported] - Neurospora crassa [Neurospora crassa]